MVLRDERGAMLLMGVFFSVFLVGALFYLVGTAQTILFREGMQDAADAAALGAAIAHARGMNFIALVNLIMAALVMILLALKLIETLIIILMGVLTALAATGIFAAGAAPAIASLERVRGSLNEVHEQAKKAVFPMLRALSTVSQAVKVSTPAVAEGLTVHETLRGDGPADFGFVLPTRMTLPVEPDDFSVLCARAGSQLVQLSLAPFGDNAFSVVRDTIDNAMQGMAGSLSSYFCGKPGSKPPAIRMVVKRSLPLTEAGKQCVADTEAGIGNTRAYVGSIEVGIGNSPACDRAKLESKRAAPDSTGHCQNDCQPGGLFDRWTSLAREQCDPGQHAKALEFSWQSAQITEQLAWSEQTREWLVQKTELTQERLERGPSDPCRAFGTGRSSAWNLERRSAAGQPSLPVCHGEKLEPPLLHSKSQVFRRSYRAVTEVFGCVRPIASTFKMKDPPKSEHDGQERPYKIEAGRVLGDESFQLRSMVFGSPQGIVKRAGVSVATWGKCGPESSSDQCQGGLLGSAGELLGGVSVAQAEYFFEGKTEPQEWLWNMNWRARLKRFRFPEKRENLDQYNASQSDRQRFGGREPARSPGDSCARSANSSARCGAASSWLNQVASLLKH